MSNFYIYVFHFEFLDDSSVNQFFVPCYGISSFVLHFLFFFFCQSHLSQVSCFFMHFLGYGVLLGSYAAIY
ncbi:hypothetical protein CXB51_021850 [Gossypium anomalum]|uniref:Uncharacterized protein n=1 Tax=Gossypium anomalum TaxID=47600 RepID=A0A8J5Y9N8_9ROSI|nr:hypothetical protein CXB51_021850 [Gossypium anomalum]